MTKPTQHEIDDLRSEARIVAFAAEDQMERDDFAEGVYQTLQWLAGDGERPDVVEG